MEKTKFESITALVTSAINRSQCIIDEKELEIREFTGTLKACIEEQKQIIAGLKAELLDIHNLLLIDKPKKDNLKIIPTHFPTTKRKTPNKLSQDLVNQVLQNLHKKNADLARMINVTASVITHIRRGTHPLVKTSPYRTQQFN